MQRYHKGERDFRRLTLSGQSFHSQNLSGANFSEADIRSTNFAKANLSQTNFSRVNCGCNTKSVLFQHITRIILGIAFGYVCAISSLLIVGMLRDTSNANTAFYFAGIGAIMLLIIAMISIWRQGLTAKLNSITIIAIIIAISIVATAMTNVATVIVGQYKTLTNFQFTVSAIILTVIGLFLVIGFIILVVIISVVVPAAGFTTVTVFAMFSSIAAITDLIAIPNLLLLPFNIIVSIFSICFAWQIHKGNEKFRLLQILRNNFGAIGGTSFVKANLTGANFEGASLESTNFRHANISQVFWKDARKLDFAQWGESILANTKVRQLLVSRNGQEKDYQALDLSGINLAAANLSGANFKQANLNNAILHHANLKNANLRETLCIRTDFSNVELTGACIQGWRSDHTTKLNNVNCQYVFLLEQPNDYGSRERRPHDPDKNFEVGDFEKLHSQTITTVELLLRGGLNRQAFQVAFEQLMAEHPDIALDDIQSIAKRSNDIQVTLSVRKGVEKGKIEQAFDRSYTAAELEATIDKKLLESERKHNENLIEIILNPRNCTNPSMTINNTNTMTDNCNNPKISVGANSFINTGKMETSGTINLGTISGKVTNSINQLPESDGSQDLNLKEILIQLQHVIETDSALQEHDKNDLLEEVKNLADAGTAEEATKKDLTRKAKKMFDATLKSLPDTAKIVEAASKLFPLILKVLGISA